MAMGFPKRHLPVHVAMVSIAKLAQQYAHVT